MVETFGGDYEDYFCYPISVHLTQAEAEAYVSAWEAIKPEHCADFGYEHWYRVTGPILNVPTFAVTGIVVGVNDDLDDEVDGELHDDETEESWIEDLC